VHELAQQPLKASTIFVGQANTNKDKPNLNLTAQ
jgi:hypothetical protein